MAVASQKQWIHKHYLQKAFRRNLAKIEVLGYTLSISLLLDITAMLR